MPKGIKKKLSIYDEIATTRKDIDIFYGYLNRLQNPDPILLTESSGQGIKLYDDVDRDAHGGSVLQTRCLSVSGLEYDLYPGGDTPKDIEISDFVKDQLERCNFTQATSELMKAVLYGFYVLEVMWAKSEGRIVINKLVAKHPRRFVFSMDRELRLLTPDNMIDGEDVPDKKFIVLTYGDTDNPYGKGIGQRTWWPVWFKKNNIKFWLLFLEKFGAPTALGKYPPGTPEDQQNALLDALDAIQNDTGIKIPETMQVELLEATRAGNVSYETFCEYMDKQISKAFLGQTASTEGTVGKLGDEKAQEEVRNDIRKADADMLAEVVNKTLITWLTELNFDGATPPSIWFRTEEEEDLKEMAERDKILVSDIGLKVPEQYFYDTYGITRPEGDEPIIGGTPEKTETKDTPQFAEQASPFQPQVDNQLTVDRLSKDAATEAATPMRDMMSSIIDTVRSSDSYDEAKVRLATDFPTEKLSEVQELLTQAIFQAGVWGRVMDGEQ